MKVSVNDIVIKAVALALRNVPEANGNAATFLANVKSSVYLFYVKTCQFYYKFYVSGTNLFCLNIFLVKKWCQFILATED